MQRRFDTAIIGGGASGLMVASLLPPGRAVVIEGNAYVGAKIKISGGGKCNITNKNVSARHYLGDTHFVKKVLQRFTQHDLLRWLSRYGLVPVERPNGCYFCAYSADELISVLSYASQGQTFALGHKVTAVEAQREGFAIRMQKGTFYANRVVVVSGGLSFPKLGASGIGYEIARTFGHRIVPTSPALVGLTLQKPQFFFKELSGVSVPVRIGVKEQTINGHLLFAHKGISGPAVLDASLYWDKGSIEIDFLPAYRWDRRQRTSAKRLSSVLPLPKRMAKLFLHHSHIQDTSIKSISKQTWDRLQLFQSYRLSPAGTFGYTKAEVTKGGVATDEIDPGTMLSLRQKELYFVGEVLDVTGRLGGYNFQWAFSSAYLAAESIRKRGKM